MFNKAAKISFLITCILLLVGCSTMQSKWGMDADEPHQVGHAYSGVSHNLGSWCGLSSEELSVGMKVFNAVVFTIDLPLSIVGDTLFLPIDFVVNPRYSRMSSKQICQAHTERIKR